MIFNFLQQMTKKDHQRVLPVLLREFQNLQSMTKMSSEISWAGLLEVARAGSETQSAPGDYHSLKDCRALDI